MSRIRSGRFLVSTFIAGLAALGSAPSLAEMAAPPLDAAILASPAAFPDEVRGSVTFNGCVVDPARIRIRAVPLGVRTRRGIEFPAGRSSIMTARVSGTADPHVLSFSIRNLAPRTPYQLGISYPPNPCGKMFWRGPEQGLVLTGSRPVRLEGFAAQTQIELLSQETGGFVGADELDFTDRGLSSRVLRWKTLISEVTGGELQLSTEPFPHSGRFSTCDEPETGVFYRQAVPAAARGRWQTLEPIDFGPLVTPAGRTDPDPIPGLTPISDAIHRRLLHGAPVYMRVVPAIGDAQVCDTRRHGVAGWVVASKIRKGDFDVPDLTELPVLMALNGQSYTPPFLGGAAQGRPKLGELSYRVTKWHVLPPLLPYQMTKDQWWNYSASDPMGMTLLTLNYAKPGRALAPGTWFSYVPKSSGGGGNFLTDFVSLGSGPVTGTWTALGEMANSLAEMTQQIKESLAKAVVDIASVVPGVPAACAALASTGTSCDEVVKAGMEYGLASMGLPPSLPNWEQLQDQGIEYLAAKVATEIGDPTGLTEKFTEQMLHDMVDSTLNTVAAQRPGIVTADWLTPYLGYDPAVWTITVFNSDPAYHPQSTSVRVKAGDLYRAVDVEVPERFPASGLVRIPVVLQPLTAGIAAPRCRMNRYGIVTCNPLLFSKTPICEVEMHKYIGYYADNYEWVKTDCAWWNWTSIYYRDAWIQQKLNATACVTLGGYSASNAGGLWLTNPNPPFIDVARLPPLAPAAWDGALYLDPSCP